MVHSANLVSAKKNSTALSGLPVLGMTADTPGMMYSNSMIHYHQWY
ncbi:MAG: hypothetical protein IJR94_06715 [Synergistaceae bacterium]|nr:hypothetical protein [Synergistaceae bacterium]